MVFFRFVLIFVSFLACSVISFSQNLTTCKNGEDSIRILLSQIKASNNDSVPIILNHQICSVFQEVLKNPESFAFPFDSLTHFGKLESPDKLFRIITWNSVLSDGNYVYFGIIQVKNSVNGSIRLHLLNDRASEVVNRENSVLSSGKWFGGLYYKILKNKVNQITYYTLLSLRYNDLFTTSKIIDVLYFDEFGNPVFGAPLFNDGKINKLRIVFEYSANVTMNLNYDEKRKMIIFDHLSASDDRFVGEYGNYGPDFSYDGYQFKGNGWKLIPDLNILRTDDKKTQPTKRVPGSSKIRR